MQALPASQRRTAFDQFCARQGTNVSAKAAPAPAKHRDPVGLRRETTVASQSQENDDDAATFAEKEALFIKLLKERGVKASSTWAAFSSVMAMDAQTAHLPSSDQERWFKSYVGTLKVRTYTAVSVSSG